MNYRNLIIMGTLSCLLLATGCSSDKPSGGQTRQLDEDCNNENLCLSGLVCENGRCRKVCLKDPDCPGDYHCDGNRCVKGAPVKEISCGNGILETGEFCDDGNEQNGDGCNSVCTIENGWNCNGNAGEKSTCSKLCGNGHLDSGEQCDDQNNLSNDGCSQNCAIENGWTCDNTATPSACSKLCGNGQHDASEECDDQNNLNDDGCNQNCLIEQNYQCTGWPSVCSCTNDYQDSNHDGHCLADCDKSCGNCLYMPDGSAKCADFLACNNQDGGTECRCVIYVKEGADGSGASWNDAQGSLETALAALAEKRENDANSNFAYCDIWLAANELKPAGQMNLDDVGIYGGFKGDENWLTDREENTLTTISGKDLPEEDRIFVITDTVKLDSLVLTSGMLSNGPPIEGSTHASDRRGAAILGETYTSLEVSNCQFLDNTVADYNFSGCLGGAVHLINGQAVFNNCLFDQNIASNNGGAGYLDGVNATFSNCIFKNNSNNNGGSAYGGALYINGGNITIDKTIFVNNNNTCGSLAAGGAIYNINASLNISNSQFISNYTSGGGLGSSGGAIYTKVDNNISSQPAFNISNTIFVGNYCKTGIGDLLGGSIYNEISNANFNNVIFTSSRLLYANTPPSTPTVGGVAIYNKGKYLKVTNSIFSDLYTYIDTKKYNINTNYFKGAAIYNIENTSKNIKMAFCGFDNNMNIDSSENAIYDPKSANNITIYYSLLDQTSNQNQATLYTSDTNVMLSPDSKYLGKWESAAFNEEGTALILTTNSDIFEANRLVGSFVMLPSTATRNQYRFPIIANTTNSVTIPASSGNWFETDKTLNILFANQDIQIIDWRQATGSKGDQTTIIDKVDYDDFDIGWDILNNSRPQGSGKDIGPFEIR